MRPPKKDKHKSTATARTPIPAAKPKKRVTVRLESKIAEVITQKRNLEQKWQSQEITSQKPLVLQSQLEAQQASLKNQELLTQQISNLTKENDSLQEKLSSCQAKILELENLLTLGVTNTEIREQLHKIQTRVTKESFWRQMAIEFAENLDDFPAIFGHKHQNTHESIQLAFNDWQIEVQDCLDKAIHGHTPDFIRARHLLIAQWVLLRWLEITEVAL